jgi:hypothetical protein
MPNNNYNYGAGYIMGQDKQSVDQNVGESKLYRQGLEFDTRTKTGVLTEDMPKKQTKPTDTGMLKMADDNSLYNTSGK